MVAKPKVFFSLALFAAFSVPLYAQKTFNSNVENEGVNCEVTLPSSFNTANSKLPDPFKKLNGERMTSKEEWTCRRQEILKLAEKTVYGTKPPKPTGVTGTVSNNSISVKVGSASFSATVSLPSTGTAPYPAVIRYDNSGADATVLKNNGVAVINFTTSTVGGGTRTSKTGAFYTANSSYSKTGHLAAWAWGVSRIIDVIEQSDGKILKADAIGVTGCSRDGKGAFVAGVLDQRVALTMPMESGTGGTNIMRGAYADRDQSGGTNGAQSPSSAYGEQPWLGDDFNSFTNNPNNLPIDMHEVIALVAPRGFLVLEKTASSAGQWLNIPSSHAANLAAAEVYKALGVGGNMHYINTPTSSHCQWTANIYDTPVKDFIDKFLHKTKAVGTEPTFTATAAPSMTKWIDWTTPTLTGNYPPDAGGNSSSSVAASSSSSIIASSSSSTVASSSSSVAASSSSARSSSSAQPSSSSARSSSSVVPSSSSAKQSSNSEDSSSSDSEDLSSSSSEAVSRILSGDILRIEAGTSTTVHIYDLKGNKIASFSVSGTQQINHSLPSGVYLAKVGKSNIKFVVK